jgi:hypothetical protein
MLTLLSAWGKTSLDEYAMFKGLKAAGFGFFHDLGMF